MEPFSPNDPLLRLLRRGREVEPRPNFTPVVLRAVRQLPQQQTLAGRVAAWFSGPFLPRLAVAGAAAVLVLGAAFLANRPPVNQVQPLASAPRTEPAPIPAAVVDEMLLSATAGPAATASGNGMDPLGVLLVHEDTSALTDSELALLLY